MGVPPAIIIIMGLVTQGMVAGVEAGRVWIEGCTVANQDGTVLCTLVLYIDDGTTSVVHCRVAKGVRALHGVRPPATSQCVWGGVVCVWLLS